MLPLLESSQRIFPLSLEAWMSTSERSLVQCVEEKAYLWSTMTQEWLSSLTVVHNDKTDSLVLTALANDFIQEPGFWQMLRYHILCVFCGHY